MLNCGFGVHFEEQCHALRRAANIMQNSRTYFRKKGTGERIFRDYFLDGQLGLIYSCYGIQELFKDLQANRGFEYLLTRRTGSDCLENYFSRIRQVTRDSHPPPADFLKRMRFLDLSINAKIMIENAPVQDDPEEVFNLDQMQVNERDLPTVMELSLGALEISDD